jgi:hypothetical protein
MVGEEMVVDAAGILAWTLRENADFFKCLYLLMMKIYYQMSIKRMPGSEIIVFLINETSID